MNMDTWLIHQSSLALRFRETVFPQFFVVVYLMSKEVENKSTELYNTVSFGEPGKDLKTLKDFASL